MKSLTSVHVFCIASEQKHCNLLVYSPKTKTETKKKRTKDLSWVYLEVTKRVRDWEPISSKRKRDTETSADKIFSSSVLLSLSLALTITPTEQILKFSKLNTIYFGELISSSISKQTGKRRHIQHSITYTHTHRLSLIANSGFLVCEAIICTDKPTETYRRTINNNG